jgi:hypothetical protein
VDASILERLANSADPSYPVADRAVVELRNQEVMTNRTNMLSMLGIASCVVAVS